MSSKPKCAGCNKELEVGDLYIEDTPSGFMKDDSDNVIDEIIVDILGGSNGKIYYCEDCTESGGDYLFNTFYKDN